MRSKLLAVLVMAVLFSGLLLAESTTAKSFPFRGVKKGDALPVLNLTDYQDNSSKVVSVPTDRGLLLVFVGADLPSKEKRSVKALKAVAELKDFLAKEKIDIILVDSQGDDQTVIAELLSRSKIALPFYVDPGRDAYGRLGIFVMPSMLLVAPGGRIAAGMGYSHDILKRLKGYVKVMSGEMTPAEMEAYLHPQMVEMSKEEAVGLRHYHLGLTLKEKGQPEMAIKELKKAIAINPKMGEAHIQLACLYIEIGRNDEAGKSLDTGLELVPDDLTGQICRSRLKAASGAVDEAIDDLRGLMFRHLRSPDLHYWLGNFYDQKKDAEKAAAEYRKGFELLKRHSLSGGK